MTQLLTIAQILQPQFMFHHDLPIVIDTGASNSISPIGSDFVGFIQKSDLSTLKQVNGTTPVAGQGNVQWNVEDFYGTRRSIITEAYFVPDAQIRLFSPQVYISTHPTAKLSLNSKGIDLTLKCGTVLHFPISKGNNLPFMLTQAVLDKRRNLIIQLVCNNWNRNILLGC